MNGERLKAGGARPGNRTPASESRARRKPDTVAHAFAHVRALLPEGEPRLASTAVPDARNHLNAGAQVVAVEVAGAGLEPATPAL